MPRQWFEVHGRTFFAHALPIHRPMLGLSRHVRMRANARRIPQTEFAVPFGWKAEKVPDRCVVELLPMWLYYPRFAWRNWDRLLSPVLRYGFLIPPTYEWWRYSECRWTLKWWLSFAQRRDEAAKYDIQFPATRWELFGRWVQSKFAEFDASMPRWST